MSLEVINDPLSEVHRNWVCLAVTRALGTRMPEGIWVLQLRALDRGGVSVVLTGPDGAAFQASVQLGGGDRDRQLAAALKAFMQTRAPVQRP